MHPGVMLFLRITLVVTLVYSALLGVYTIVMLVVALFEARFRRRQDRVEDYDLMLRSRYSNAVSIVAPIFNEELMAVPALRSLLAQDYHEFELIAVDDGSTDGTMAALVAAFELEPSYAFYSGALPTKPTHLSYRSRIEPRLTVVSKQNGGKADTLNCGVNFARNAYLCCVDGDTVFEPDALLKAMTLVGRDPARILGATSLFGISVAPESSHSIGHSGPRLDAEMLGDFQHLDMMRAFAGYRAAWSRLNCMLCVSGAFALWRRDIVVEVGGFSPAFSCEDIEMTFRVHERMRREKRDYSIISLPAMVAQTEGPQSFRSLILQRARWQRVTLETTWHYRRMLGRPRYGVVGMLGLPYYLLFECLAPFFQIVALVALVVAAVYGLLGWATYLAFLALMSFGTAVPTTVAVSLHDRGYRDYRLRDLIRMMALGPLDLFLYRPVLMWAALVGTWQFARKQKGWDKFERNARPASPSALAA